MYAKAGSFILIATLVTGCSSSHETTTVTRHDDIREVSARDPGLAVDRESRRNGRMVVEDRVPSTATEITQRTTLTDGPRRTDSVLLARPAADGEVWLVDAATGRIVYGGHLRRGETLLANLTRNELSLNGRPLSAVRLDGTRNYKIYFHPG